MSTPRSAHLRTLTFSGRRHSHRIVRHGGKNSLLGVQLSVSRRVCPALSSAFFSFVQVDWGFSVRRAQGTHRKPLDEAAPSHNPQGINRSHRRNGFLKPILLANGQLFDSAAPLVLSVTSVRTWLIRAPTNSRAQGCLYYES